MTDRKIDCSSGSDSGFSLRTSSKFSSDSYSGFTIIEVALVLAIAGLIFLVVFLALPALQNSQKDTARREDVGRVVSALEEYETDNGSLPPQSSWYVTDGSSSAGFSGYVGKLGAEVSKIYEDPANTTDKPSTKSNTPNIGIYPGQLCDSTRTANSLDAAVAVALSSGSVYCADM